MKKEKAVIINGSRPSYKREKLIAIMVLTSILVIAITFVMITYISNKKFAKEINDFSKLNAKTVFSIDKIYMYSSANANQNSEDRAIWNLNINQFTDIALYINNRSEINLNYENSIKEMYIENIRFSGLNAGIPTLYYKDINEFGKSSYNANFKDDNNSKEKLNEESITKNIKYKVLNDGDIDYSKPQIYADCSNPITLEYVNRNIKENAIISDITTDVKYDGTLLKKTGIILSTIKCIISFDITIINNYNQKFIANVYLDVPLEDTDVGTSIYEGKFVKKLENTNLIKFFRIE